MPAKVYFRKVFPYDPTFGGELGAYDGYRLIALKRRSPEAVRTVPGVIPKHAEFILASSQSRSRRTAVSYAASLPKATTVFTGLAREITFDLGKMASREKFRDQGSRVVRQRFIEAFIANTLVESRREIQDRLDRLVDRVQKLPAADNVVVISHSFLLKVLQSYLSDGRLFERPRILARHFDPALPTFAEGGGFDFERASLDGSG